MFGKKEKKKKKERIPDRFVKVARQRVDVATLYIFVDRYTLVQYTATHIRNDIHDSTFSSFSPILDADGKPSLYDGSLIINPNDTKDEEVEETDSSEEDQ